MTVDVGAPPQPLSLIQAPLLGRLYSDWLGGRPELCSILSPITDPARWAARPAAAAGSPALWPALRAHNERLGASPASLQALDALARGEADAVITGQQPGFLGGPLFTLYKLAVTVALAERATRARSRRVVPLLWVAADDSDFPEIRSARLPRELELHGRLLTDSMHQPHRMVGTLDRDAAFALGEELLQEVDGPHGPWVRRAWSTARDHARDFGDLFSAFLLALLPEWPFVVVDARLPELRAASAPLFCRYLERRPEVVEALRRSGEWLHDQGYEVKIQNRSGEHSLYRVEGDLRQHWEGSPGELRGLAGQISANVVLRPLAQDSVLPVLSQVVGPGEAAYLVQVYRVAGVLEAPAPALFPRLSATLWPAEAQLLCSSLGVGAGDLFASFDAHMRRYVAAQTPPQVVAELDTFERSLRDRAEALEHATHSLDSSLAQLIESARAKMDYQLGRVREGVISKIKARHDRAHPRFGRLKGFLLPQEKLQERTLGTPAVFLQWGPAAGARLMDLALRHVDDSLSGKHAHYLAPWEG